MNLDPYIESIQEQLLQAGEAGGDEARAVAQRLVAPLEAAMRLALQDALAAAAAEITCELAPGAVELRLRGRDLEFLVERPPVELPDPEAFEGRAKGFAAALSGGEVLAADEAEPGGVARINLRLPDHLKARVETASRREGLSVNTWLVRAASGAVQSGDPVRRESRPAAGGERYSGWAR
jgi:hypothetical protein